MELHAPQAFFDKPLQFASGLGFANDWLTGWTDAKAKVWFDGWTPGLARDARRPAEFALTRASKYSPFEDGVRMPILLRWDGHIAPGTHEQLVSSVDLLPTVLEAVGKPAAGPEFPGRSLLAAAQGKAPLAARPVFGETYPRAATSLGLC